MFQLALTVRLVCTSFAAAASFAPSNTRPRRFSPLLSAPPLSFLRVSAFDASSDAAGNEDPAAGSPDLFPEHMNIIYDSKCSVCQWEVDFLRSRMEDLAERGAGGARTDLFLFTDLESADGYDASDPRNGGVSYEEGMRTFMAVRPDGSKLHGVQVFREAYDIVGLGWVFALTRTPLIGKVADAAYKLFARFRTDLTRGAPVDEIIKRYYDEKTKMGRASHAEEGGECIPCREKSSSS